MALIIDALNTEPIIRRGEEEEEEITWGGTNYVAFDTTEKTLYIESNRSLPIRIDSVKISGESVVVNKILYNNESITATMTPSDGGINFMTIKYQCETNAKLSCSIAKGGGTYQPDHGISYTLPESSSHLYIKAGETHVSGDLTVNGNLVIGGF